MEKVLCPFDDPAIWNDLKAAEVGIDTYVRDGHISTGLLLDTAGHEFEAVFPEPLDISDCDRVAFSLSSFTRFCIDPTRNPYYKIVLDGVEYEIPTSRAMVRVELPLKAGHDTLTSFRIVPLHEGSDYLIISDLRGLKPELPQDLLWAFKRELDREIAKQDLIPVGQIDCRTGDASAIIEADWDWLERNLVLRIGDELHQIANRVDNKVSFLTTYDGETIKADYTGEVYAGLPVEVGYYDREIALPGIALWYQSPRPVERHSKAEERALCTVDGEVVMETAGSIQTWRVTAEIAAHHPELVQRMAGAVRRFLARSTCWVNGLKLWWTWKDAAADSEPVADYDIVPRANYSVDIEVQESIWNLQRTGTGNLRLKVYSSLSEKRL